MNFLEITLCGGVFIFTIALFRALALRRLPKQTFVALWWAAAARLLIPLELTSRFSVYTLIEALRPKAAAPAVLTAPAAPTGPVLIIPSQPLPTAAPAPKPFPVWTVLWFTGAALLALWFLIRYIRWRRRFRESLPLDCPGLHTWLRFRRKIQLRSTDQIAAPLTYGLVSPVILLPKRLDLSDEEAVTCVLAHELAHIRHLDGLLKLVLAAALCIHWFNPAAWVLYVLANRDMELRCDEEAVLALGEDSRERYALALIRLAENVCVSLCGFSQKNGMEERIRAIMTIKKKSLLACALALVLALGITTAFATSAEPAGKTDGPEEDPTDTWFYAETSVAVSAEWDEVLAPYVPFGLAYEFDDPDHDGNGLTMWFEGREVRGIFDEKSGVWITEHAGNGTYGEDAAELYTLYDENGLTGLRFATEEEQAAWTETRESAVLEALGESIRCEAGDIISFTIPETDRHWGIFISGRIATEDGMGLSVRYLEDVEEWISGQTYSFETADAAYDELTLSAACGDGAEWEHFDLTKLLPKGRGPLDLNLPEGREDVPGDGSMIWPVDSVKVTNCFGDRANPGGQGVTHHSGVDIGGLEQGAPVYAAAAGTVKEADFDSVLGNYVRLDHGNGLETLYAHCRSAEVKAGDTVTLGQTIATVGSTGQSTGPHLHFEIIQDGVRQNPEMYLASGQSAPEAKPQPQSEAQSPLGEPEANPYEYAKNNKGETYGTALTPTDVEFDLIAAVNEETGVRGYISSEDISFPYPCGAEEIKAYMNWTEENQVTGYMIPLYDSEHNVIGTFQIGEGGSGSKTWEEMKEARLNGWPNSKGSALTEKEPAFASMDEAGEAVANGWT